MSSPHTTTPLSSITYADLLEENVHSWIVRFVLNYIKLIRYVQHYLPLNRSITEADVIQSTYHEDEKIKVLKSLLKNHSDKLEKVVDKEKVQSTGKFLLIFYLNFSIRELFCCHF